MCVKRLCVLVAVFVLSGVAEAVMNDSQFVNFCGNGSPQEIYAAIEAGANVNAVGGNGLTALMTAAANNSVEAVAVLLGSGANINAWNDIFSVGHYAELNTNRGVPRLVGGFREGSEVAQGQVSRIVRRVKGEHRRQTRSASINSAFASSLESQRFVAMKSQADQGASVSQYMLASMYESGQGTAKNPAEAARWYEKSASQGYAMAQFRLGEMYRDGVGVSKSQTKAAGWLAKAAQGGHPTAKASLKALNAPVLATSVTQTPNSSGSGSYVEGKRFYDARDYKQALDQFTKAAKAGDRDAQYYLGVMHEAGDGVKQNNKQAADWFRKAADAGHGNAARSIASMYEDGRGVPKSPAKAREYYAMAGSQPPSASNSGSATLSQESETAYNAKNNVPTTTVVQGNVPSEVLTGASSESNPFEDAIVRAISRQLDSALIQAGVSLPSGGVAALLSSGDGEEALVRLVAQQLDAALVQAGVNAPSSGAYLSGASSEEIFTKSVARLLDSELAKAGINLPGGVEALLSGSGGEEVLAQVISQQLDSELAKAGVNLPGGGMMALLSGKPDEAVARLAAQQIDTALAKSGAPSGGFGGLIAALLSGENSDAVAEAMAQQLTEMAVGEVLKEAGIPVPGLGGLGGLGGLFGF
ncbi:MAG: hypothetical protein LBD04_07460 [Synergistaceae bacterium]|jgi:TPR repeat protein|nr:hypothetical protein [Synergistaceae bacterium]